MSDGFFIVKGDIYTTDRKLKIFIMTVEVISINKINNRVRGKKSSGQHLRTSKIKNIYDRCSNKGLTRTFNCVRYYIYKD